MRFIQPRIAPGKILEKRQSPAQLLPPGLRGVDHGRLSLEASVGREFFWHERVNSSKVAIEPGTKDPLDILPAGDSLS
jgi:hypothetical protein